MEATLRVAPAGAGVLANFPLFRTSDPDEARDHVSRVFCEHRLQVTDRSRRIGAEMYFRPIRGIGVGRMRYGASVAIDPGELQDFALIQMPLCGTEVVEHGKHVVNSTPEVASVLSPTQRVNIRHDGDTEKIFVRINREALERHCRQHLGGDLRQPVEFLPRMSLLDSRCRSWTRLVGWLCDEIGSDGEGDAMLDSPLFAAQVEQMVITTLLACQPHNYSERLASDGPSLAPHFIKRAERYIEDNAHEPLTIGDIAEHVGVSARSLFAGFRRYRDTTPMHYLKDVRMNRVHQELLCASPESSNVTSVAMRWGFSHLGHFAVDYRRRFGESPSATLNR